MIGNYFARLTGSKRNLLALLASSAVFTAGCANMSTTAPSANPFSSPATLSGSIHGGNQPVFNATVTLWFTGQGGSPSTPATKAATTTSDASGSFSFTKGTAGDGTTDNYACPTNVGDPLVYVIAQGGNTQNSSPSQNNSAAAFIALYGSCAALNGSNFVYMSEVTTVATMAAVQQFFNPTNGDTLFADGTGQQRLVMLNLPNTVALMASATTGLANGPTSVSEASGGSIAPGVTLTVTPETAKINTLANIISACINAATAADTNCTSLFSAAKPPAPNITNLNPQIPNFPTATDTLQALYYIFTNPTNGSSANMTTLFGLQPATGAPYVPLLTSQPTDWTVGVKYASSSTCGTTTGGSGNFISSPTDINIDGFDNVWFGNAQMGGNLSSISAAGAPLYCLNFDAGLGASGGTFDSFAVGTNNFNPNVWFAAGTTLYRYNPTTQATLAFPVAVTPLAIAADGVNNVYFTAVSGSTGSLYVLVNGATVTAPVAPLQISNTVGSHPLHLMPDYKGNATLGNIWVSSGGTFVSQVAPSLGGMNGFATTQFTISGGNSYGVSVSRSGIFFSALDTGAISYLIPNGATFISNPSFPFTAAASAGINAPKGIAVDGRTNAWIANSGFSSVSQISPFSAALSPSTGFQKASSLFNANSNVAVDQAGNVWVAGAGNTFITEIVGEGVPIYAPYAVGLANGRFQTIP
jgi:hypothetical protein